MTTPKRAGRLSCTWLPPTCVSPSLRSLLNSKRTEETAKLSYSGVFEILLPSTVVNLTETLKNLLQVWMFLRSMARIPKMDLTFY